MGYHYLLIRVKYIKVTYACQILQELLQMNFRCIIAVYFTFLEGENYAFQFFNLIFTRLNDKNS